MKTKTGIVIFTLVSAILNFSCTTDPTEEDIINTLSSIKDGKILSGKIANYQSVDIDKLEIYTVNYEDDTWEPIITVIAEGDISDNGQFSLTLQTPSDLINIQDYLGDDFEGEISDKMAFIFNDDFLGAISAFKGNEEIGYVFKGNGSIFEDWAEPPFSVSLFIYSDRKTTVKGQDRGSYYSYYYDFTLNKGWNEIVWKILEYSDSKSSVKVSNEITEDMVWKFTDEEN